MPKAIRQIRVDGNIAYVPLTQGYEAVIDAADVPLVEGRNWTALVRPHTVYAYRKHEGKTILLHRFLMGAPIGVEVDHIDRNGLNNRRHGVDGNLRVATGSQNQHNTGKQKNNTSGFKGVSFDKDNRKWRASISIGNKKVSLGRFSTKEAAHAAYCEASERLHGDFGRVV